jgi:hypothetical protein
MPSTCPSFHFGHCIFHGQRELGVNNSPTCIQDCEQDEVEGQNSVKYNT